jgi:phosphodiester glycosidase
MRAALRRAWSWLSRFGRWIMLAVVIVVVAALALLGWSYVHALTAPGTDSLGAKSVEWVRGHGGRGLVQWVETEWYSHHPPPTGGVPDPSSLPKFVTEPAGSYHRSTAGLPAPTGLASIVPHPVAGEGHWVAVGRSVDGVPAVYATFLQPDAVHTKVVTGVAWMDTDLLKAVLYSGYQVPGGKGWANTAPILPTDGPLVAAFNSGFRLQDADGSGYYTEGRTASPLINGYASFVIYKDGRATVGQWGRDVTATADIASVRQNLALIVDGGHPVPGLANNKFQRWGATLGNKLYVSRSGVGVTADGALVYAGGPDLSIYTLAEVLARAGAVRAMELDINTDWVDYYYFNPAAGQPATPANGSKLLPKQMAGSTKRYFEPSSKDFIAMFADPTVGTVGTAARLPTPSGG